MLVLGELGSSPRRALICARSAISSKTRTSRTIRPSLHQELRDPEQVDRRVGQRPEVRHAVVGARAASSMTAIRRPA